MNVFSETALALARVGENLVGIDLSHVLALLESPLITPLPRLPECCEGIVFWQGGAIPVYDLKKALNLPTSGADRTSREAIVLVGRWRHAPVGLRVDEAFRVIEAPPLESSRSAAPQLRGEATFEGRRLYVLEPQAAYPGLPQD